MTGREPNEALRLHANTTTRKLMSELVESTLEKGGDLNDILVITESIVAGIVVLSMKLDDVRGQEKAAEYVFALTESIAEGVRGRLHNNQIFD